MHFQVPLSALLAQALTAFTADFEQAVADAGFPDISLALGSNVLRFLDDKGLRIGSIASLAGVSKQAISQQIAYLERHGYVEIVPDATDNRAKVVRLTDRGQLSQEVCRPLLRSVEEEWQQRYGKSAVGKVRRSLETLVPKLGDSLPHYPR